LIDQGRSVDYGYILVVFDVFVLPFQGEILDVPLTQGGALRLRRGALPWAGMFWAFQAKDRRQQSLCNGRRSVVQMAVVATHGEGACFTNLAA
jgi:hypothetical protein